MGTGYCLGNHEEISLTAYEMSGSFDVYTDIPKELVDMDAWSNKARVDLWKEVDPERLFQIGLNIMEVARQHLFREEIDQYFDRVKLLFKKKENYGSGER